MFSRSLIIHKAISNAVAHRAFAPLCVQRSKTSVAAATDKNSLAVDLSDPQSVENYRKQLRTIIDEDLPKPYDGPERDHVNFPRRKRAEYIDKVRMGFLPDEWFTFFYKKTGVTGPYVFGTGLLTFLLSKEWYVIETEFSTGVALFIIFYTAIKKFGPATKEYADKLFKEEVGRFDKIKGAAMQQLENGISEAKKEVWHQEGQKLLLEAKRENIQMQLETEYRRRMMHVYEQVKKRLDYQLDMYNTQRKLEQKHMVDWIVNNVVKSITPQQEKEALSKCIQDLKGLSIR